MKLWHPLDINNHRRLRRYASCFSALILLCGAVGAAGSTIDVFVGYGDGIRAGGFFPNPWLGSANTIYVGTGSGLNVDAGAIRIDNNSAVSITINDVHVTLPGGQMFDLWGSNTLPAGDHLIVTQTSQYNFDTSDYATLSGPPGYPDGETAHAPHIDITVNGVLLPTFLDTGHILTTGGFDYAQIGNESFNWRLVGTSGITNPGGQVPETTGFGTLIIAALGIGAFGFFQRRTAAV